MDEKSIAIITARGGSKRIPKKNIKEFCGKPIMEYVIEAVRESNIFEEIMVSTDDEEIKCIAEKAGAKVPFMRSEAASNDYATTREVLLEVLQKYREMGRSFDYMACLYPTNPFLSPDKLKAAMSQIRKSGCNAVIPVVQFSFPPQRAFVMKDGYLAFKWEEYRNARSQDLEPFYHDAGQYYFYDVQNYLKHNGEIKEGVCPVVLPEYEVQDIDNETDWKMAELKYQYLRKQESGWK